MTYAVVYDPAQALHDPRFFLLRGQPAASPERAERGTTLLAAAQRCGLVAVTPPPLDGALLAAVHDARYLAFLEDAWPAWQAVGGGAEVVANVHPQRPHASYPTHIVGRAGWHMGDTACPLGEHSWTAARAAAATAAHAARLVLEGAPVAYALCRPPGHHAFADMAAGFCFLNNAAIAAEVARTGGARVAILDVDVHHGNGTQAIFYGRGDVLHVSLHADPSVFYPWFWGYAHERGQGAGEGATVNLPLPLGTDDAAYLEALEAALDRVAAHGPEVLVVALGLDIHEGDPLAAFRVTTDGFARIAERIARRRWPTVLVQEGGYPSPALGRNLERVLEGWAAA
ncbi:MAG: histone deacetylase family protein [Pseudomonadota bacterium]